MKKFEDIIAKIEKLIANSTIRWSFFALIFFLVLYNINMFNQKSEPYSDIPENIYLEENISENKEIDEALYADNLHEQAEIQKFIEEELQQNFIYDELFIFRNALNTFSIPYDESASASLLDKIKQIDNTILQTLKRLDIPLDNLKIDSTFMKLKNENYFLFQKIALMLPSKTSPKEFKNILEEHIKLWAENLQKNIKLEFSSKNNRLTIYIDKECTHEIFINKSDAMAKMSIVIDDMGVGLEALHSFLTLDFPVSFSILPKNPQAKIYAEIGHFAKREIFLHQPMDAENKIFNVSEGLSINDSIEEIKKKLETNLAKVPFATALNNHTGSSFTANRQAVINFLLALRDVSPKLHILDSVTIGKSQLQILAPNYFQNTAKRDVFIDNVQQEQEIIKQLDLAMNKALKDPSKHIIVIGHPHKATQRALKNWDSYKDKNIEIVPVFQLH